MMDHILLPNGDRVWVPRDAKLQKAWNPFKGPRGGQGWKSTATGEVRYQDERPGEAEEHPTAPEKLEFATPAEALARVKELVRSGVQYQQIDRTKEGTYRIRLVQTRNIGPMTKLRTEYREVDKPYREAIEETIASVFQKFNVKPITRIHARTFPGRKDLLANMSWGGVLELNTAVLGSEKKYKESEQRSKEAREFLQNEVDSGKILGLDDKDLVERAREALTYKRELVDPSVEGAVTHELGHHIDMEHFVGKDIRRMKVVDPENMDKFKKRLSLRAADSAMEYVAESFVAYLKGEEIDPTLKAMFDGLRK